MESVRNQDHYSKLGLEPIDIMRANMTKDEFQGFLMGNIIKYSHRQKGTPLKDIRKLQVYTRWLELELDHTQIDELKAIHTLCQQIPKGKYKYVETTGRGGLWVAAKVAYYLGIKSVHTFRFAVPNNEVLFVDDIADSGDTIRPIKSDTAVLVKRHNCPIQPTYVGVVVDHDDYVNFTFQETK